MRSKEFEELNETELIILKKDYEKWKEEHGELWPFKEESYYKKSKKRFNFLIEEKDKEIEMVDGVKKVPFEDIKLSEEIKTYGITIKNEIKNVPKPHSVFQSVIPYNGFKIILTSIIVPKEIEHFYYSRAIYGWWNFCAQKDKLDEWDKKILENPYKYCIYTEKESPHHLCNDNQQEESLELYNLHPNDMVKQIKESIERFYKDKEKLKDGK